MGEFIYVFMPAKKNSNTKETKASLASKVSKPAAKKAAKKAVKKSVKKAVAKTETAKRAAEKESVAEKPIAKPQPALSKQDAKEQKNFDEKQYQKLLDLRDSILDIMRGVTQDTLKNSDGMEVSSGGMHAGDASSDSYDRDFALNLLAMEQDSLSAIEKAISRAEAGVYGICEMSGERIPKVRLEAIPFARFTVECQEAWEKENGHLKRHSNESFSFSSGAMR